MVKTKIAILICLIFAISCLSAYAEESAAESPQQEAIAADTLLQPGYKLQKEDVFRMVVFGEPELAAEQIVDPKGFVNIPLIGSMFVEGMTQDELVKKITEGLSKYLVEPKVQITLSRTRNPKVYVLGQVFRPGLHEFRLGERVLEAVAQGGGFQESANLSLATLTRKGSNDPIPLDLHKLFFDGDMSQNLTLEDGDTIFIPEDTVNKYFVLGEVLRPSMYRLKDNVTVIDAISNAGGPNQRGSLQNTYIIRGDPEDPERIKVDVSKIFKDGDISQNLELMPGDVVYVAETSRPNWQQIAQILSSVVNTSYLFRMWGW